MLKRAVTPTAQQPLSPDNPFREKAMKWERGKTIRDAKAQPQQPIAQPAAPGAQPIGRPATPPPAPRGAAPATRPEAAPPAAKPSSLRRIARRKAAPRDKATVKQAPSPKSLAG